MAFFLSDGEEYFSFSLEPNKSKKSYVFLLSPRQACVSTVLAPAVFLISVFIFFLALYFVLAEVAGIGYPVLDKNNEELLILALSGLACVSAFFEIVLFFWIRRSPASLLSESRRVELRGIRFLKNKSSMIYLAFLLCMTMPLISIGALPGGFGKFFSENVAGKSGVLFFLVQLLMFYFLIAFFILKSLLSLIKK